MRDITIVRKRLIPEEEVILKHDNIIYEDEKMGIIVTNWLPIKPRGDIGWGFSVYNFVENCKISGFYDKKGKFAKWYCDIVKSQYYPEERKYIVTDLLIDVVKYASGKVELLDEEELELALTDGIISVFDYNLAILTAEKVVNMMKKEDFNPLSIIKDDFEVVPPIEFKEE